MLKVEAEARILSTAILVLTFLPRSPFVSRQPLFVGRTIAIVAKRISRSFNLKKLQNVSIEPDAILVVDARI